MKKKTCMGIFLLLYLFYLYNPLGIQYTKRVFFNYSSSLPIGIYLSIPGFGVRNGDIVAYYADDSVYNFAREHHYLADGLEKTYFIKHVATPGHTYEITEHGFFVDNFYIGDIAKSDHQGNPLPQLNLGHYVVQPGEVMTYTSNTHSFDSRYFGPVKISQIETRVIPLLTFP